MSEAAKRQVWHDACDLIITRRIEAAAANGEPVRSIGAYTAKVRSELEQEHREHARSVLASMSGLPTAAQLVDILEPPGPTAKSDNPISAVPFVHETPEDTEPPDRETARRWLATIRESLAS